MDFSNVQVWIFDLDNTLYPPEAQLFAQIETRMTAYMMRSLGVAQDHANRLRVDYWRLHGTTLAGLMADHAIDPTAYLADVHDIDFSVLTPDPDLADAIAALPGRRIIHTNGDAAYARRVLAARALPDDLFEAVYGIEETGFHPKPGAEAFHRVLTAARIDPGRAAFFEDDPRNLVVPHDLGMRTVLVGPGRHGPDALLAAPGPHVHHQTFDLTGFLRDLTRS
ncbi:pyrimidine 5'-nucleotidase [Paracoccus nototheniae]|uniref:Pyrimidine 5'-nucleotidase n=1 Tax=Paracoccus nototheniae TaxID=2489002 RepID=A0ABW4DRG9_9RHOB|nr:pyrimidine 5'-nucleotidase [Paracoccus nototheniae]